MKKTLALLLALCMMLSAIPALSEGDVTGTWYVVMMELTAGTIDLKDDGTSVLITSSTDGDKTSEGTWTQDGDKITLTVNEQPLPLVCDGDTLQISFEDLASLGLDSSMTIPAGADTSVISSFLRISREPGVLTVAELNAYQNNGTLPEGKTKEDMDAFMAQLMSSVMSLIGTSSAESAEQQTPGPALTYVETNFYVRRSFENDEGVFVAKVRNDTDTTAYLSGGSLILLDDNGNNIGESDFIYTVGSSYLDPGEETFVSLHADVNEGAEAKNYTVDLQTSTLASYQTPDTALEVSSSELRIVEGQYFTSYYTCATVTNTTDAPLTYFSVVTAIRDNNGALLDLNTSSLYQHELASGSTITLVENIDSRVEEYCSANGLTLSSVESIGCVNSY